MSEMVNLLLGKMNLSAEMINKKRIFPTVPYFRKNTRELIIAVKQNDINNVRLLVRYVNRFLVFDYDDCHQTALIWACKMNFTNIAIFLIDHYARVNWQDIGGRTAIYFAVQHSNFTLVKYLLLNLADPGIPTLSK